MKTLKRSCVLAVALSALLVTACESEDTKRAEMDGMILTDSNGGKWIAKHSVADAYFLYSLDSSGKVNWCGNQPLN